MALRLDDVDISRDRALVQRFQAGDDDAFDELYRRYHDRLERFCLKRLGDQHAAEEVAQEAFTRALTALPDLGGEQRFYPWVSVIAARLCVDHFRRQARAEPYSDPNRGVVAGSQEESLVDAVDASLVVAALARLAPRHQDVLHLREVEGWSYQRIADHYRVKVSTVETLLFRARRALRREFRVVDGTGLAAIPLLGRIVHLAARVRQRVPAWVPAAPSGATLAAAATATVAAVAFTVVPGWNPAKPPRGAPAPPAHAATAPLAKRPALVAAGQPAVAAEAAGTDATAAAPAGSAPIPVSVAPARTNAGAAGATMPSFAPAGPAPAAPASTSIPSGAGAGSETIVGPMLDGAAAIVPPVALPDPSTVAGSVAPISVPPIPPLDVGTDPAAGIVPLPGAGTAATGLVGGVLAR